MNASQVAARLEAAFAGNDLDLMAALLAPDVRWGGEEDTDTTCHDRTAVLAFYGVLHARGVTARVTETLTGPDVVVARLDIDWPEPEDDEQPRGGYQVFSLTGGLITDICGYPDRAEALAAAGL
ncbi:nuclear transport factor 2 family protein [Longispora sp. K20-0274]|uniref:nuclear transport factor 2 family protein n=1 Tax=Longispora sp. K20-0274 TaxID=3088255 RepID=UPI00399AFD39